MGIDADFISLCRLLITEPDLPNLLQHSLAEKSPCLSGNNYWPENDGDGIACKCPLDQVAGRASS